VKIDDLNFNAVQLFVHDFFENSGNELEISLQIFGGKI